MSNSSCKKLNQIICIILLLQGTYYLTQISQCKNTLNVKVEPAVQNIDPSLKRPASQQGFHPWV